MLAFLGQPPRPFALANCPGPSTPSLPRPSLHSLHPSSSSSRGNREGTRTFVAGGQGQKRYGAGGETAGSAVVEDGQDVGVDDGGDVGEAGGLDLLL
jgi:hypothetical protein